MSDVMQLFVEIIDRQAREKADEMAREMSFVSQAEIDAAYERGVSDGRKQGYTKARREDLLRLQRSCPDAWDETDADFVDDVPQSVEPPFVVADEGRPVHGQTARWANRITVKQGVVLDAIVGGVECGMNGQLSTSQLATLCEMSTGDVANCLTALRKKGCISWATPRGEKTMRVFEVDHDRIAEMTRV